MQPNIASTPFAASNLFLNKLTLDKTESCLILFMDLIFKDKSDTLPTNLTSAALSTNFKDSFEPILPPPIIAIVFPLKS